MHTDKRNSTEEQEQLSKLLSTSERPISKTEHNEYAPPGEGKMGRQFRRTAAVVRKGRVGLAG